MKKCMIVPFVTMDSKTVWSNEKFAVVETLNKRVDVNSKAYGHAFKVYELCEIDEYGIGDCLECFDTLREAMKYVKERFEE